MLIRAQCIVVLLLPCIVIAVGTRALAERPEAIGSFIESQCVDCHSGESAEAGLDLQSPQFDPLDKHLSGWVLVHDRVQSGEMPPADYAVPDATKKKQFLKVLARKLEFVQRKEQWKHGRADVRRLNRDEYENSLRSLLDAPWLMVADELPADGTWHLFSKSGESLAISHVQMRKYLDVGKQAIEKAVNAAAYPSQTSRYYARDESGMNFANKTVRANIAVVGWKVDASVMAGIGPKSAKDDPELRNREAVAAFYGPHPAYTRYDFEAMNPPIDGHYKLRLKSYSIAAGTNGYEGYGLDPDRKAGEREAWYRPNRLDLRKSDRTEPITIYALRDGGDTRLIGGFDAKPTPHVYEQVVTLRAGDNIRPDAARLCRLRPGFAGNPLAVDSDTIPGWALQWLEVEGPLAETWPPKSYTAVFGNLPFSVQEGKVKVQSKSPEADAKRLLASFVTRAQNGKNPTPQVLADYLGVYEQASQSGFDFTDAMITACSAVLTSPGFLYFDLEPGELDSAALATRLSYFLWNAPPDAKLQSRIDLRAPGELRAETSRLLSDPRCDVFIEHFLDHWLDVRNIHNTVPDAELFPEYYLDSHLTESALLETRLFFRTLVQENLPVRNLVDSDFAFVNERLARHYGIAFESQSREMVRVELPEDSPRGGLMTQAAVLKVTANGTTTSPVMRGVWIVERLLGRDIPAPPSGIDAIEPDTRGATTIKEQLAKHVEAESCAACHLKFDPIGFALENFDVMGGWQTKYRAIGDTGEAVEGFGMNGHRFKYRLAGAVESHSKLQSGKAFDDIQQLKQILVKDERTLARNLVQHLVIYSTGAAVSFADRRDVEKILDEVEPDGYRVADIIHALIQSPLFLVK